MAGRCSLWPPVRSKVKHDERECQCRDDLQSGVHFLSTFNRSCRSRRPKISRWASRGAAAAPWNEASVTSFASYPRLTCTPVTRQSCAGSEIGRTIRSIERIGHTTPKRRSCSKLSTSATAPCVLTNPSSAKRMRRTSQSTRSMQSATRSVATRPRPGDSHTSTTSQIRPSTRSVPPICILSPRSTSTAARAGTDRSLGHQRGRALCGSVGAAHAIEPDHHLAQFIGHSVATLPHHLLFTHRPGVCLREGSGSRHQPFLRAAPEACVDDLGVVVQGQQGVDFAVEVDRERR